MVFSAIRSLVTVSPVTVETHETGLTLAERYNLSIYDAMIVASALLAGCDVLWSEDMQDGMAIENRLRIINPFRAPGRTAKAPESARLPIPRQRAATMRPLGSRFIDSIDRNVLYWGNIAGPKALATPAA